MKRLFGLIALVIATSSWGQINVHVKGNIFNTTLDSVCISQYYGTYYKDYLKSAVDKKGNFSLKGNLPAKDYYVVRFGNTHLNIILKDSSNVTVNADGKNILAFHNFVGSDETIAMNEFIANMQVFGAKRDSATAYLRQFPDQQEAVNQSFQQEYNRFNAYRQQFIAEHPNSPALLPVINTIDVEQEFPLYESLVNQLSLGFSGSPNIESLKQQYAKQKEQMDAKNLLAPGKMAPDFTQNDVNGKPVSLSSLKGKVVLIDFWASWCGPCRRENPNVVALYDKYQEKGFTVLSVSLDKDKNAWMAAIQKDNLKWPNHVSDLKQWSNDAARLYQVTGIPFTVLVDQEGKIINTNLRGPDLERTLVGIFGY